MEFHEGILSELDYDGHHNIIIFDDLASQAVLRGCTVSGLVLLNTLREINPRIAAAMPGNAFFEGMSAEQSQRLAATTELADFGRGQMLGSSPLHERVVELLPAGRRCSIRSRWDNVFRFQLRNPARRDPIESVFAASLIRNGKSR